MWKYAGLNFKKKYRRLTFLATRDDRTLKCFFGLTQPYIFSFSLYNIYFKKKSAANIHYE